MMSSSSKDFTVIHRVLLHVLGGSGWIDNDVTSDPFTLGLDWLALSLQKPGQRLPVLAIIGGPASGKRTMLLILSELFGDKYLELQRRHLTFPRMREALQKHVLVLGDMFPEKLKPNEVKVLHELRTSTEIWQRVRGENDTLVPNFGKMVVASQDVGQLQHVIDFNADSGRNIMLVNPARVPTGSRNLTSDIIAEIPAFRTYLMSRQIHHTEQGRHFFNPEYCAKVVQMREPNVNIPTTYVLSPAEMAQHRQMLEREEKAIVALDKAFDDNDGMALIDACSTELEVLISGYKRLLKRLPREFHLPI